MTHFYGMERCEYYVIQERPWHNLKTRSAAFQPCRRQHGWEPNHLHVLSRIVVLVGPNELGDVSGEPVKTVGKFGHISLSHRSISILAAVSICRLLINDFKIPSALKTMLVQSENKVLDLPVLHRQGLSKVHGVFTHVFFQPIPSFRCQRGDQAEAWHGFISFGSMLGHNFFRDS